ncbi:MAG TPA: DNA-directed RNA polymerase subunit omega [Vicinamibacterales bacterium]|nr:DNA-directed RNA polymerase subunit omega [Vicinamibacterales bacterium]
MATNADTPDSRTAEEGGESQAPITSRFLFVDVAAQRAKQLRRGALARLDRHGHTPHKLERVAMEEVRSGLIAYQLPTPADLFGKIS